MKKLIIDILPIEGMPDLEFGITADKVAKKLGDPEETELLEEDEEFFTPTLIWHYPEIGLSFFFEGEEHELTSIESDNHDTLLFGAKVFSLNKAQIIELMRANGYEDEEQELEAWGEDRVSFEDALIDFYFAGDQLVTVDWGIIPD
ncbi:MAG: hypothetical protein KA053_08890 [Lentimicrobiaceae bacterium]|nr:hypothetical protein [Lentimicrobiaceae bacterium]